jgi:hypothetical protein
VEGNGSAGSEVEIDTSVAHVARVYDYLLGGTANFEVDRAAAERAYAAWPGGLDGIRNDVRAQRAMQGRMVRYLTREAGIRQFLDIGAGIPGENSAHVVAQREAPDSRVVYVDRDAVVLDYARRLLSGTAAVYVYGELRELEALLEAAAETLDFSRPVAVMLFGVLHFFGEPENPRGVVDRLAAALVPGSYLALGHLASDVEGDAMAETFRRLNADMVESVTLRGHDEVVGLFGGLELVEPGVVQLTQWRPDPGTAPTGPSPVWCGLARKVG